MRVTKAVLLGRQAPHKNGSIVSPPATQRALIKLPLRQSDKHSVQLISAGGKACGMMIGAAK